MTGAQIGELLQERALDLDGAICLHCVLVVLIGLVRTEFGDDLACGHIDDRPEDDTAQQRRVGASIVLQRGLDALGGTAVALAHDDVLRHVHKTTGEVAGVGRLQRGIGETLAGTVGGDEVLEDRQALHEVALDRALNDLALRVGHTATHTRELADLLERATRTGVGHHEDGVQAEEVLLHRACDLVGGVVPQRDYALVALLGRHEALGEEVLKALDFGVVLGEDLRLLRRDHYVVLRDGDARLAGEAEAQRLERVEQHRDRRGAVQVHELLDELAELTLGEHTVLPRVRVRISIVRHQFGQLGAELVIKEHAAGSGDQTAAGVQRVLADLHRVLQCDNAVIERAQQFFVAAERLRRGLRGLLERVGDPVGDTLDAGLFALRDDVLTRLGIPEVDDLDRAAVARLALLPHVDRGAVGEVVQAKDHVLAGHRDRAAVGRRQDVVGREHEDAGLGLRLH